MQPERTSRSSRSAPASTTGLLTPAGEKKIKARLKTIDSVLRSGLLEPALQRSLEREPARLQQVRSAGAGAPNALLSPELTEIVKARIADIDHTLLAGLALPPLEQQLKRERAALQKLLKAA
jgi:hypothetical protein